MHLPKIVIISAAIMATVLVALILFDDRGSIFSMASDDFASLGYGAALLLLVASGVAFKSARLGENIRNLAIWVVIALAFVTAYAFKDEAETVTSRVVAALFPSMAISREDGTVTISRSNSGDFTISTGVNGQTVDMIFDTGASAVVLTLHDAERAGIEIDDLSYSITVSTANGTTRAAPVLLDTLAIGAIEKTRVRALVAQRGDLQTSLLGMTFLDRLKTYTIAGDTLTLTN